jgi:hypothetical protein
MLNKQNFNSKKVVEFSSLALTPKEGIPAFLIKFQDCDSKLRLLGFLELTGALGEVLRDGKYFKIREKFSYTIINSPADFNLYYCIVEQKCKNNITGKNSPSHLTMSV